MIKATKRNQRYSRGQLISYSDPVEGQGSLMKAQSDDLEAVIQDDDDDEHHHHYHRVINPKTSLTILFPSI